MNYTRDKVFIKEKIETSAGWVGLVDKLELGTDMDYYTFIIECPLFVARQWHRHRFGSYNEISRRYTAWDIKFYIPEYLRKQASSNKQASVDEPVEESVNKRFKLRTHEGAQKEIRELAEAIVSMVGYRGTDEKNVLSLHTVSSGAPSAARPPFLLILFY